MLITKYWIYHEANRISKHSPSQIAAQLEAKEDYPLHFRPHLNNNCFVNYALKQLDGTELRRTPTRCLAVIRRWALNENYQ